MTRAPNWVAEATAWVDAELEAAGLARTADIQPVRDTERSQVARVFTSAGPMYLKRPSAFLAPEGAIVACLAALAPEVVPAVVAFDPEEGWWLSKQFLGDRPAQDDDRLARVLGALADLQVRAMNVVETLVARGCPDYRLEQLPSKFDAVVVTARRRGLLDAIAPIHLDQIGVRLAQRCTDLAAAGLPTSVVHGDLTPWNVAMTPSTVTLFDWANCFVGPPFIDSFILLANTGSELRRGALVEPYLRVWSVLWTAPADVLAAVEPLCGACFALVAARHHHALQEPSRSAAAADLRTAVAWCARALGVIDLTRF